MNDEALARDRIFAKLERHYASKDRTTTLEQCDGCGSWCSIWNVEWDGKQMICQWCRSERKQ